MKTKIKTKTIISLISLSFLMLFFSISVLPVKAMANPASEYCIGVGGTLEIRAQEDGGQYGVCIFSDGSECEEWALYNGDCQKGLINDEIKDENVKKQIINTEKIQRIYNKLNKLSDQGLNENIDKAKRMAEFDQKINVRDLNVEKSRGLFGMIGTFLFPVAQDSETEQIGILPDSKLYPFKEISRKFKMAFTFNAIKKVELQQRFANEKLLEAEEVYEKNKDPEQAEKLLEEYSEEAELISERMGKIVKSPKNQAGIDNLLDNLADHLIKRQQVVQNIQEKLKNKLPLEKYEKMVKQLDWTVGKLGVKIERLEGDRESLKERFVKIAEQQEGSEFKDFKNLEILKEIEEKMPSETSEVIKEARETIKEKFIQDMSKMNTEKRMNFKNYINEIDGNTIRHLEIVQAIESEEISPEVRVEIEKAKEKTVEKIVKEMKEMKSKQQRENFLKVLENPEIEKLRVINELEDKFPSEFLNEIKEVKEKNIRSIQKKIKNNLREQKKFIEKAKKFHDVSQFEILEEIGSKSDKEIKAVIDEAEKKAYEEFKKDIERAENGENKRIILEKLTTNQLNHIEVLNRVQKKIEIRQLEGKFTSQSTAPKTLNRVINMQIEKINSRIENMDDKVEIEKIKEQIQKNEEIKREIESRIPNFERKIRERRNLIKEYRPILKERLSEKSCKNLCGDGICQEIVCLAIGCPCAETTETCPEDCKENSECAKEGEQVNRNPLMGSTDKQCCPGLIENRISRSYSICEKATQDCAKEGESVPVVPGAKECCPGLKRISCDKPDSNGNCREERCGGGSICANCGNGVCGLGENKCNCPEDCKEEVEYDLDEYYSNIDYSCNTNSDCVIKDVHNCCGYYPKCVNKNTEVDADYIRKACAVEKMGSACGYPSIDSCRCVQNKCEGFFK